MRPDSSITGMTIRFCLSIGMIALVTSQAPAQLLRQSSQTSQVYTPGGPSVTSSASRSVFASPFVNQPFSISGMNGSLNRLGGSSSSPYPGSGTGNGLGGLGLVAPGWWGLGWGPGAGYWGPGYGMYPSAWWVGGWNTGFNGNGFWGPGWDPFLWNDPFMFNGGWPVWNNGFVWDWGFLGAFDNVVQQGNARFGMARPVRQQRAAANGIQVPGNMNPGGLNAVPPFRANMNAPVPNMPLIFRRPAPGLEKAQAQDPASAPKPDRLQTANRLARNGLLDEALDRYREAARANPQDAAAWVRIAQVEALADRPEAALEAFANGEKLGSERFTEIVKSMSWADISDKVSAQKLRTSFAEWSKNPKLAGIEKLRASLESSERPEVARNP